MPKITISEKDLTTAGSSELLSNIIYIPGYSNRGPVNTPTLCTTLSEFQNIFGIEPYTFKNNQPLIYGEYNDIYAYIGENEKSYYYAAELVNRGLPILFERYMSTNNIPSKQINYINAFTAHKSFNFINSDIKLEISAKNPGSYGKLISYKFEVPTEVLDEDIEIETEEDDFYLYPGSNIKAGSKISGNTLINDTIYDTKKINLTLGDIIKADSKIAYGSKLEEEIILPDEYLTYKLIIIFEEDEKELNISFNPSNSNYYKKINSNIINIKLIGNPSSGVNLVLSFLDEDLATIEGNLIINSEYENIDEFDLTEFYGDMGNTNNIFQKIFDYKSEYNVKIITSGSYPTFSKSNNISSGNVTIANNMIKIAEKCGDAFAIIDHFDNINFTDLYSGINSSWLDIVNTKKYGTMFSPWGIYNSNIYDIDFTMPASFGYLSALADSSKTNENWYAVAGITRGRVPSLLQLTQQISGAMADNFQQRTGISINPILNINPYGYCIWGNRTLNENNELVASSFLNIRMLVNDIKKLVYTTAKELTFELNSDILWLTFKSKIEPTLDRMVSGNGLNGYKIIRVSTDKKATIKAIIRLYPIEAVEDFDITIELADSSTVTE